MRKGIVIAVSVLGLSSLLVACGNQKGAATGTKTSSSVKTAKSKSSTGKMAAYPTVGKHHQTSHQTATPWNQTKSQQLATFMDSWGTTMKQQYESYGPGNNTDFYGLKYPAEFHKDNLMANEQAATFAWSSTGKGPADYEVVGIYSDSEHVESSMGKHLYLFTLHEGQPVVLITEQNQGNEENKVYFKTTANTDLADGFSKIVDGQGTTATNKEKDSQSTTKSQSTSKSTPVPYDISSDMRGTWYAYNDDNKMSKITFTAHTMRSEYAGEDPETWYWYHSDGSDPDDRSNIHDNWGRADKYPVKRNGVDLVNVRGWNQSAGDGSYYGVKEETVSGKKMTVFVSYSSASILCDTVYYRSLAVAKQQGAKKFDDISYSN